jgi:hypothetical protein
MKTRSVLYLVIWALGIFVTFETEFLASVGLVGQRRFYAFVFLVLVLFASVIFDTPNVLRAARERWTRK